MGAEKRMSSKQSYKTQMSLIPWGQKNMKKSRHILKKKVFIVGITQILCYPSKDFISAAFDDFLGLAHKLKCHFLEEAKSQQQTFEKYVI